MAFALRPTQEGALHYPRGIEGNMAGGAGNTATVTLSHAQIISDDAGTGTTDARQLVLQRARSLTEKFEEWRLAMSQRFEKMDLAPDLAEKIGSGRWFRGVGTLLGLSAIAIAFWPDFAPLEAAPAMSLVIRTIELLSVFKL